MTTESEMESNLQAMIEESGIAIYDENDEGVAVKSVRTYRDAGLLTNNKGLVLTLTDGSEFQLQIVRSK